MPADTTPTTPVNTPRKKRPMRNPYEAPVQRPERDRKMHNDPTAREVILRIALQESRRNAR